MHLISSGPHWVAAARWDRRSLTRVVRQWLLDEDSLTRRLIRASDGHFRVRVLRQQWRRPLPEERGRLELPSRHWALVREVALECHGEPWVYARSVLPQQTLRGPLRHLRRFGDSSLGELLFTTPGVRRAGFEVCCLPPASDLLPPALRCDQLVWGRRSCFWLHDRPLLVCEFFLPAHRLGKD